MTDLVQWGSSGFPHEQSFAERLAGRFSGVARRRRTVALGASTAIGLAASACLGIAYVHHERLLTVRETAVVREEQANADLQQALAQMRDQVAAVNQALRLAQRQIAALGEQSKHQMAVSEQVATSKTDRIAQLAHALEQVQRELQLAEAQRATLMARLSMAETAGREQFQKKLQELSADRDRTASERDRLRARIEELKQKLSAREQARSFAQAQPAAPQPTAAAASPPAAAAAPAASAVAAAPAAQPAAPPRQVAVVVPHAQAAPAVAVARPAPAVAVASGKLGQFERVLASAGVDVTHLFAQYGMRTGIGGPFVPVPRGGPPTLSSEQLSALQRLVSALPVSAPLAGYRVGSPFGVRGDPMNGRHEFHTGLDMLAPYMSPVYATAPGTVTYAGYRDDYGKVVEIDHGHGISTRYAHLHRYIVSVGERVAAHTQIGFLGSTGRATGPHVHYEVLVNGEPQDPEKFLGLARLVPVAAR